MSGKDQWDAFEAGEDTDDKVEVEEVQEAVEADIAVKPVPEGYDPYYDDPVPKGVGGSFVLRDGKRYRRRPE
jgi:hypothetical protein